MAKFISMSKTAVAVLCAAVFSYQVSKTQVSGLQFTNVTAAETSGVEAIYLMQPGGYVIAENNVFSMRGLTPLTLSFRLAGGISAHTAYENVLFVVGSQTTGSEPSLWKIEGNSRQEVARFTNYIPTTMAVGRDEIILTSDGTSSIFRGTEQNIASGGTTSHTFSSKVIRLSWNYDKYWVLEESGELHSSDDGLLWTRHYTPEAELAGLWLFTTKHIANEQLFVLHREKNDSTRYQLSWTKDGEMWKSTSLEVNIAINRFAALDMLDTLYFGVDDTLASVLFSIDEGKTWEPNPNFQGVRSFAVVEGGQPNKLIGTSSALYVKNYQMQFTYTLPIPAGAVEKMIEVPSGIAVLRDNNVRFSLSNGSGGRELDQEFSTIGQGLVFAGQYFFTHRANTIYRYFLVDMMFEPMIDSTAVPGAAANIERLFSHDNILFYADEEGNIFYSADFAETWTQIVSSVAGDYTIAGVYADESRTFIIAENQTGYSVNEWNKVSNRLEERVVVSKQHEISKHFAIHQGRLYAIAEEGSGIIDVVNIDNPSDRRSINIVEIDDFTKVNTIIVEGWTICIGTSRGLLMSSNIGETWNLGLDEMAVQEVLFRSEGGQRRTIFASTLHNWIFHSNQAVTSVKEEQLGGVNGSIFPIPAADVLHVRMEEEIASLEIYDALGNLLVRQAGDGVKAASVSLGKARSGVHAIRATTVTGIIWSKVFIVAK